MSCLVLLSCLALCDEKCQIRSLIRSDSTPEQTPKNRIFFLPEMDYTPMCHLDNAAQSPRLDFKQTFADVNRVSLRGGRHVPACVVRRRGRHIHVSKLCIAYHFRMSERWVHQQELLLVHHQVLLLAHHQVTFGIRIRPSPAHTPQHPHPPSPNVHQPQ